MKATEKPVLTGGLSLFIQEPDRSRRTQNESAAAHRAEAKALGKNASFQDRINIDAWSGLIVVVQPVNRSADLGRREF